MSKALNFSDRPIPNGFSHAIEVANVQRMLFISGQVGRMADGTMASGIVEQIRVTIGRLDELLKNAGMAFTNVTKVTIFMTVEAQITECWAAYAAAMPSPPPAATLVVVSALATPEYLVEIEAIAVA